MHDSIRLLLGTLAALLAALWLEAAGASAARVAVLDFELKDLTPQPATTQERDRTAAIAPLLQAALARHPGIVTLAVDAQAQSLADHAVGYLFDRPRSAAELGASLGADWVAVGRLHKPSFLFAYLMVRLVHVASGRLAGELIVEVKGVDRDLARRGADRLAEQIVRAIKSWQG